MSDTELNRMRDFGCGKPHWSPYYVDAAYEYESRAIEGDKSSMLMTVPIKGEFNFVGSAPTSARGSKAGSRGGSRAGSGAGSVPGSARPPMDKVPEMKIPDPMANTFGASGKISSRKESARSLSSNRVEQRRIEDLLKKKELELNELKEQLAVTKGRTSAR